MKVKVKPKARVISWSVIASLLLLSSGCVQGQASTHELEHETPAHWPVSPGDAADKIEARLQTLSANSTTDSNTDLRVAQSELLEIIGWAPEVVAETDLREAQWLEVYQACEQLQLLSTNAPVWSAQLTQQARELSQKLRAVQVQLDATKIPDPPPESDEPLAQP